MKGTFFMKSIDIGVLPQSCCYSFTPSELSKRLYYYLTWCGHYYCNNQYYKNRESYPYLLLLYICKGTLKLEYEGQTILASAGDTIFIDCLKPHHYRAQEGLEFLYIHFDGCNSHEIFDYISGIHGYIFQGKTSEKIADHLRKLIKNCKSQKIISSLETSMFVYETIYLLNASWQEFGQEDNIIEQSMVYIKEHVEQKMTLDALARRSGLSKYRFAHVFKDETGYAPMEYVLSIKLDHAKVLLKSSHLSIAEISYAVGYDNPGTFTNLFKKKVGVSPKYFRISQ